MAPTNTAAYLLEKEGSFAVKDAVYTSAGPGELVIKNAAMAINPMDWKIQSYGSKLPFPKAYPAILGADIAGTVVEVGEGVTGFKEGDRVLGVPSWFRTARASDGGFQEYTILPASVTALLPASIPFVAGCVLPLGISTSAMGLYPPGRLGLPLPTQPPTPSTGKVVLIWGGSSSMGSTAIQLAAASGVKVITTASPKNHAFVKSLTADVTVLSYHDENVVASLVEIIKKSGGEFLGALDAVGEEASWSGCAGVVKALGGGKVVSNNPRGFSNIPESVEYIGVNDTANIMDHTEIVTAVWARWVPAALAAGTLKTVPEPILVGKGLEHVGGAVEKLKAGVSAGKIVVEI